MHGDYRKVTGRWYPPIEAGPNEAPPGQSLPTSSGHIETGFLERVLLSLCYQTDAIARTYGVPGVAEGRSRSPSRLTNQVGRKCKQSLQ